MLTEIEKKYLNPTSQRELVDGLLYLGKVFFEHCWTNLEATLIERKALFPTEQIDLPKYNRHTYLSIVLFFSYIDGIALSAKKPTLNATKNHLLKPLSRKNQILIEKPDNKASFEDLMKIQFSILPQAIGIPSEYGTIKHQSLPYLYKLREVRNKIVHPTSLYDLVGVDIIELDGKDITTPMIEFFRHLQKTLNESIKKLIPRGFG